MKLAGHNHATARPQHISRRRGERMTLTASIAALVVGIAAPAASASRREPPPPPPPTATYSITDLGNLGFQATFRDRHQQQRPGDRALGHAEDGRRQLL